MSLRRYKFVGWDEYFSILSKYGQLFRDLLGEDEDYFDDTESDDSDFCSLYDFNGEE